MKDPLNTCLKDRYTLIEQSDLNTLIEQSQYSSEEQCSKLIDKEIWLVMGSYQWRSQTFRHAWAMGGQAISHATHVHMPIFIWTSI